ncbi:MAG: aspartate-semialdehyde dehydrogenase [Bdellovibrionaceae bacterium]|nr:aspartate-semialdehyde dehydrogenase [Bdellovibrio sp.]
MKLWKKPLKVGLVGATGVVGETFINILEEYGQPIAELRPFASVNSLGMKIELAGKQWPVQVLKADCFYGLDMVFFSSGDDISLEWAPEAVRAGAFAIDNSNAFRMNPEVHLVVPEVNGHLLNPQSKPQIIANPNCSTIQLVVALKPLLDKFGIDDVTVSTYQAVSGAGLPGYEELIHQTQNYQEMDHVPKAFTKQILFNCIPQIGTFGDDGFSSEESKIMTESPKILGVPDLKVSAFTVRIPALNSHSEAVWVTLKKDTTKEEFTNTLGSFEGLAIFTEDYPTALEISGEEPVFVGRIHQDRHNKKRWLMWVVADNLKKGAALNGLQIAETIFC